jgi:glucose/arabinose dehydrogenase
LLSIALHPTDSGRLFVHYTGSGGKTVLSEFSMSSPVSADPDSEKVLLEVRQPASNHNGGMIQFDSRGYLLVGLGDGGGANDQFGNGQNLSTLLGGLVRIDVDTGEASLFNYGLRNPWRFWIDGDLIYVADVGQNTYEEVSVVELEEGTNFGWPITEGLHCFRPSSGCDTTGLTLPVIEIAHGDGGTCSVTGGLVYRGAQIPELVGEYFYSDYCGGYLRSLRYSDGAVVSETDWTDQVGVPGRVTGFGLDGEGELYVTTESKIFRLVGVR